jgi:pimeloyl-ACP methyl ester carboxylesterase
LAAAFGLVLIAVPAAGATEAVRSVPVAFRVVNSNTSQLPCSSDAEEYTVRGHLTGRRTDLAAPHAVTLYLFGYDAGEWNWRLTEVPRYDFSADMARLGHVSLTIDQLGYGASDHPDGMATCMGAQADMAHQIVAQLRSGDYVLGGGRGVRVPSVVLAGHDVGGLVAEIEAYSYKDVAGLIEVTWADQGQQPYIIDRATQAGAAWCTTEPQRQSDEPGAPSGYHYFTSSVQEFRERLFFDPDPAVLEAASRLRARNPCGMIRSVPNGVPVDKLHAGEVAVPVLVVFGDRDTLVWTREGEEQQQDNFTGSADRTTAFIPNAGHFPMLERTAPQFRAVVANWLSRRGFGQSPAAPTTVRIPRQRVAVGRTRRAHLRLACVGPSGVRCVGGVRLSRRGVTIGAAARPFSIPAGRTLRATVRLSRRGHALVRGRRRVRVLVVVGQRAGPVARRKLWLVARRARAR